MTFSTILSKSLFFVFLSSTVAFSASKPKPSGPLKVFKGPEGELIAMVEANDSKEMLVHFKGIGGELEGKTKLYLFTDNGDRKDVYFNQQWRKSKTRPWVVLVHRDGNWEFSNPTKPTQSFRVTFSQADTDKTKVEDVLNMYQP